LKLKEIDLERFKVIKRISRYDYKGLYKQLIIYFVIIIVIVLILLLIFGYVGIRFYFSDDLIESYGFLACNYIVYGGFMVACQFFILGTNKKTIRYTIIISLVFLFIFGIGTFNVEFYVNLPLILYPFFSMSNENAVLFMYGNIHIFGFIFVLSVPLIREKRL
jgi:hypothetical protein